MYMRFILASSLFILYCLLLHCIVESNMNKYGNNEIGFVECRVPIDFSRNPVRSLEYSEPIKISAAISCHI